MTDSESVKDETCLRDFFILKTIPHFIDKIFSEFMGINVNIQYISFI